MHTLKRKESNLCNKNDQSRKCNDKQQRFNIAQKYLSKRIWKLYEKAKSLTEYMFPGNTKRVNYV